MVYEPSVFEPLKFYYIYKSLKKTTLVWFPANPFTIGLGFLCLHRRPMIDSIFSDSPVLKVVSDC